MSNNFCNISFLKIIGKAPIEKEKAKSRFQFYYFILNLFHAFYLNQAVRYT